MQCVILAGGLGTRMKPYTERVPKALIPVGGRTFVDLQLTALRDQGVSEVVFCIGYLGEMLVAEVGDGSKWRLHVAYSDEGENLRGTGGALKFADRQGLLHEEFFLLYGDSYLPISFPDVHKSFKASQKPALMTVYRNEGRHDSSNACFDGRQVTLYDKKTVGGAGIQFIDYGLSLLRAELVRERIPSEGNPDLAELFHQLSIEGLLAGFEAAHRFYEIGSPQGLKDLENYLEQHPC